MTPAGRPLGRTCASAASAWSRTWHPTSAPSNAMQRLSAGAVGHYPVSVDERRRGFSPRLLALGCAVIVVLVAVGIARNRKAAEAPSRWQQGMNAVYHRCRDAGGGAKACYDRVLNACMSDPRWSHDPIGNPYHACPPAAEVASRS
jgi:hypothetical protein